MDFLRNVRIPRCAQPTLSKLAEDSINVIVLDDNRLTKSPVTTVAGEEESIPIARHHAERRVREIIIAADMPEI